MSKKNILDDIESTETIEQILPTGGYVFRACDILSNGSGYIDIIFDICEGIFTEYFSIANSFFPLDDAYLHPCLEYDLDLNKFSEYIRFAEFIQLAECHEIYVDSNGKSFNEICIGMILELVPFRDNGKLTYRHKIVDIKSPTYIREHYNGDGTKKVKETPPIL